MQPHSNQKQFWFETIRIFTMVATTKDTQLCNTVANGPPKWKAKFLLSITNYLPYILSPFIMNSTVLLYELHKVHSLRRRST